MPILMVSARTGDADKIRGLGFGADDYIEKPFSPSVLVARVKAHLAQVERLRPSEHEAAIIKAGTLTAKPGARQIFKNGAEVPLKNKEYELLLFLMQNPGVPFSREDLLEKVWGYGDFLGDVNTVDVTVSRLRKKLERDPSNPEYLITKRGVGYYIQ